MPSKSCNPKEVEACNLDDQKILFNFVSAPSRNWILNVILYMKQMKNLHRILFFFLLLSFSDNVLHAQNRHLSLGIKQSGLCFGNSKNYNGIRLNLIDKRTHRLNGINLALYSEMKMTNGISTGILMSSDSICNGLKIGGLVAEAQVMNGLMIGGLAAGGDRINGLILGASIGGEQMNGVGLSGIMISDTLRGAFFQLIGLFSKVNKGNLYGFSFSIFVARMQSLRGCNLSFYSEIEDQQGISIGGINRAKNLYGIQIGLWNVAENKKRFKGLPLINFNFKKPAV